MTLKKTKKNITFIERVPGTVYKEINGTVYILDYQTLTLRTLNETASFIWRKLSKPQTVEELTTTLTDEFAVEAAQASKDIKKFLNQYQKAGFLREKKKK